MQPGIVRSIANVTSKSFYFNINEYLNLTASVTILFFLIWYYCVSLCQSVT